MPTFSRWMPPAPEVRTGARGWMVLVALAAAAILTTGGRLLVALLLLVCLCDRLTHRARVRRLAAERAGEDIGTFARALDRRAEPFDARVVRAVWDALAPYVTIGAERAPLRPTDRIDADLGVDQDDVDMCIVQEVAARAGRSLDRLDANALYGRVSTVGDLVRLLSGQPARAAA